MKAAEEKMFSKDFLARVESEGASPALQNLCSFILVFEEQYEKTKEISGRLALISAAKTKLTKVSKAAAPSDKLLNEQIEWFNTRIDNLISEVDCSVSALLGFPKKNTEVPVSAPSEEKKKEKERKKAREKKKRQREKKSKAPDSTAAVLTSLSESSGSENENSAVKNGGVPEVKILVPDSDDVFQKLKTGVRDEAFWKCLYDGFLKGSGECFLRKLQENGVWQTLFPANVPRDDEWFLQRVKQLDAKYQSGKIFPPETLAALLVVRGIRHKRPSVEDKVQLHAACQIPFLYDYRFDKQVEYHNGHKAAYLEQAVVPPFRFDYSSKPYREWKLFQRNKPKSDVSENGVSQVARPSV